MSASRSPESPQSPFAVLGETLDQLADLPEQIRAIQRSLRAGTVPERRLLTVKEAAALVGLSEPTMHRLIKRGIVPVRVVDSETRVTRIAVRDLDAWVESLPRREIS